MPSKTPPNIDFSESAQQLFDELRAALSCAPDYVALYNALSEVLNKVLVFNTQFLTVQFRGPYAKLSYLLKQHGAKPDLVKAVNDARIRISEICNKASKQVDLQQLKDLYLYDLGALCRLVALIYECDIPDDLRQRIGTLPGRRKTVGRLIEGTDCIRCIVNACDDDYIYASADGYDDDIKVHYLRTLQGGENGGWAYLRVLVKAGTMLHLVRPRVADGGIIAELIIVEPDYLVNISEVARCFTPYSDTHLNHLINKLRPDTMSEALILGNFAGQLLDEEINGSVPYAQSVKKFFQRNAFSMLATDISQDFHNNAKRQKYNISRTFAELPSVVKSYDKSSVVLEPSFFSPMLGLQGRVDLMQMDFRFLIEQKSGKAGGFSSLPTDVPHPKEDHYVQMLLYMMIIRYNYRKLYERNQQDLNSFLLYSKYDRSLCGLGFSTDLMFQAIKVRNEIVAAEFAYADTGFGTLESLSADHFRQKAVSDNAWMRYFMPQVKSVLDPIGKASDLERKYYLRMLRFIANEHLLSKIGNNQLDDHGLASIWLNSLDLKLNAGNIYTDLTLLWPTKEHQGAVDHVVLAFERRPDNNMANFRKGDIVILYSYRRDYRPDASSTMIIRCSISEITTDRIELALRAPQSDARIFDKSSDFVWAVEHDFLEASFAPLYRGMHALLSAPKSRRDLLMMQRPPIVDNSLTLKGDYGAFNELSAAVKRAKELFLIIGPPGTGKTSYGMLNTLKEQLLNPGSSVMITSYTNRAIDEICSKLVAEGIDFIRLGSILSTDPAYIDYTIPKLVERCPSIDELRHRIMDARVIVGTTTAFNANSPIFALKHFDLAIVDEASQILEPHLMPILAATHGGDVAVNKVVMIGDHKQLPAVVQQNQLTSSVEDHDLIGIGLTDCRLSLFERLLRRYGSDPSVTYMLTKQGRMHREISEFPNQAFYGGKLQIVPLEHQAEALPAKGSGLNGLRDLIEMRRLAFIDVDKPSAGQYVSDKVNLPEAEVIAALVSEIYEINKEWFSVSDTVGVIVPYRNQITAVRKAIDSYGYPGLSDISVDTVERYQGSQRDYIIFGFTVQRFYQLQFLASNTFEEQGALIDRKLNVAMTRARKHLFMVGNQRLLRHNIIYQRLIDYIKERRGYFDIPVDKFVIGDFNID